MAQRERKPARGRRWFRGLAMTEMAIALPVLAVLIIPTAEFGRAFLEYNTLSKSLRDAARYAASEALFGSTGVVVITDRVRTDVRNLVVYGNTAGSGPPMLDGWTVQDVSLEAPGDGDILVRARYTYTPMFSFVPTFDGSSLAGVFGFEGVVRMRAL